MGLCVSTSAFNQLLKAQLECGLLTLDVKDVPGIGPHVLLAYGLGAVPAISGGSTG